MSMRVFKSIENLNGSFFFFSSCDFSLVLHIFGVSFVMFFWGVMKLILCACLVFLFFIFLFIILLIKKLSEFSLALLNYLHSLFFFLSFLSLFALISLVIKKNPIHPLLSVPLPPLLLPLVAHFFSLFHSSLSLLSLYVLPFG